MLVHPDIDPVAVHLGPLAVHWYGLMYLLGFWGGWGLLIKRGQSRHMPMGREAINDLVFYIVMGVILGGRLGYILFYNLKDYLAHPLEILAVWHGGMSFHGGLIGTIVAGWYYCRKHRLKFMEMADIVMVAVPLGLGLGRLGNFINAELWGRPTSVPWAMVFPTDPMGLPRHPSQLYEFGMEGLILFAVLWGLRKKPMPQGTLFWIFITLYGCFRIISELFREPDAHLSFIFPGISAGMILSIPMVLGGLAMIALGYARWGRPVPSLPAS